jgi:hypothetical protein
MSRNVTSSMRATTVSVIVSPFENRKPVALLLSPQRALSVDPPASHSPELWGSATVEFA